MPEIAEVRLISDGISSLLKGQKISSVKLVYPETNWSKKKVTGLSSFQDSLEKGSIVVDEVKTRGKFCWIELENDWKIMIQFGMSGNIRLEPTDSYLETFNQGKKQHLTREQYLKDCLLKIDYGVDSTIYYHDIRRFGTIIFTRDDSVFKAKLGKLGHDPLQDRLLTDREVVERFRRHNQKNISVVLMDQGAVFTGVGNYIRSEILYQSKVNPYASVCNISDRVLVDLYKAYINIARAAYDDGGASLYTFTGLNGDKSDYKYTLKVYGKKQDPLGNRVVYVGDKEAPAKRSLYWVPSIQTEGLEEEIIEDL